MAIALKSSLRLLHEKVNARYFACRGHSAPLDACNAYIAKAICKIMTIFLTDKIFLSYFFRKLCVKTAFNDPEGVSAPQLTKFKRHVDTPAHPSAVAPGPPVLRAGGGMPPTR